MFCGQLQLSVSPSAITSPSLSRKQFEYMTSYYILSSCTLLFLFLLMCVCVCVCVDRQRCTVQLSVELSAVDILYRHTCAHNRSSVKILVSCSLLTFYHQINMSLLSLLNVELMSFFTDIDHILSSVVTVKPRPVLTGNGNRSPVNSGR